VTRMNVEVLLQLIYEAVGEAIDLREIVDHHETSLFAAIVENLLCPCRADTGNESKLPGRGGVQLDSVLQRLCGRPGRQCSLGADSALQDPHEHRCEKSNRKGNEDHRLGSGVGERASRRLSLTSHGARIPSDKGSS